MLSTEENRTPASTFHRTGNRIWESAILPLNYCRCCMLYRKVLILVVLFVRCTPIVLSLRLAL